MSEELLKNVKNLLASGKGDSKRLREIIEILKRGEAIVLSDYRYIQTLTESVNTEPEQSQVKPVKRDESLEVLRVRLAEGQITIEEFRKLKAALTEE